VSGGAGGQAFLHAFLRKARDAGLGEQVVLDELADTGGLVGQRARRIR
jgi:hypothetical protein